MNSNKVHLQVINAKGQQDKGNTLLPRKKGWTTFMTWISRNFKMLCLTMGLPAYMLTYN